MRLIVLLSPGDRWSATALLVAAARNAAAAGIETIVATQTSYEDRERPPLPRPAAPPGEHAYLDLAATVPARGDWVLFADPLAHHAALAHYGRTAPRFVQLMMHDRAAPTGTQHGYAYRLFAKPMDWLAPTATTLALGRQLAEVPERVRPVALPSRLRAFAGAPLSDGPPDVAFHAGDGDFVTRVADALGAAGVRVRRVAPADVVAKRVEILQSAAVVLAAPGAREALHLPTLEGMAAGTIAVIAQSPAAQALPGDGRGIVTYPANDRAAAVAAVKDVLQSYPVDGLAMRQANASAAAGLATGCEALLDLLATSDPTGSPA
ncbi:hypothetical protein [Acuticoccus mangrovi]|uniref:Glycosyltransferase n=1 Tax=Acuticoccus mangrovi TaxID=2796142 RepID=A0A934IL88_9HYPH|nr:hypothetical protein [Acuticoccus mangrovi]MBJ3774695.1 hypothetical protein [Acuticoccus mangrovi]